VLAQPNLEFEMHPPLDRPHPDCQEQIDALRTCHATTSKFKFWGCNELKFSLDRCFKDEKARLLETLNIGFEERRRGEEDAFQDAIGQEMSWGDYLKQDKEFLKATKDAEERKKNRPHLYTKSAEGPK
jgi:COX assembly protein 2